MNEVNFIGDAALVVSTPYLVGMNRKVGVSLMEHDSRTASITVASILKSLAEVSGSTAHGAESTRCLAMATTLILWLEVGSVKHVVGSQLECEQVNVQSVEFLVPCV